MRAYSNFLLFEDILSNLPPDNTLLYQAAQLIINPFIKIIENDCGTLLGYVEDLNFQSEGLVELATDLVLTRTRITQLLSQGIYSIKTRNLHSCISSGGVCQKCYASFYPGTVAPEINSQFKLVPMLNYQVDNVAGNNYASQYTLTQSDVDYDQAIVFKNGVILTQGVDYTISGTLITFSTIPSTSDIFTIRYFIISSEPLLGYMARSYSGDLLGLKPLPTLPTPLRESLYGSLVSEGYLAAMQVEIAKYKAIPSTFLDYIDTIHDTLEKILFILYLYAIYSNIEI